MKKTNLKEQIDNVIQNLLLENPDTVRDKNENELAYYSSKDNAIAFILYKNDNSITNWYKLKFIYFANIYLKKPTFPLENNNQTVKWPMGWAAIILYRWHRPILVPDQHLVACIEDSVKRQHQAGGNQPAQRKTAACEACPRRLMD